jgi:SpoVK/Ycf46/Vps4 family AAA+-type ATPase
LWYHLQKNKNKGIYGFKEFPNCESYYDDDDDRQSEMSEKKICDDIFVVDQSASFEFEEKSGIYCKVSIEQTERNNDDKKNVQGSQMETVKIQIYSYKKTMNELENYVNKITENYLDTLYESRRNTSFIYSLVDFSKYDNVSKENTMPLWDECRFNSSRRFDTIFFEQKEQLINKLDFFENNRDWYQREGHPYTLGIGLHGPPGTGKTSIIKCIANKLKRHLVVIPLSKIKTQRQFHQAFFENEYSHKNAKNPISFDKKIIVFEDIDCMADVIMERKRETNQENTSSTKDELLKAIKNEFLKNNDSSSSLSSSNSVNNLPSLSSLMNSSSGTDATNDKITLSFILNVIDGIRETPGRIMIIIG